MCKQERLLNKGTVLTGLRDIICERFEVYDKQNHLRSEFGLVDF